MRQTRRIKEREKHVVYSKFSSGFLIHLSDPWGPLLICKMSKSQRTCTTLRSISPSALYMRETRDTKWWAGERQSAGKAGKWFNFFSRKTSFFWTGTASL